ncbi:hypothetical protein B0H19DRAFT_1084340 [Mycena capillaripes]|nr:hypothetical protein B0H19DRAFT_1084340 [Mycena capillaripes]
MAGSEGREHKKMEGRGPLCETRDLELELGGKNCMHLVRRILGAVHQLFNSYTIDAEIITYHIQQYSSLDYGIYTMDHTHIPATVSHVHYGVVVELVRVAPVGVLDLQDSLCDTRKWSQACREASMLPFPKRLAALRPVAWGARPQMPAKIDPYQQQFRLWVPTPASVGLHWSITPAEAKSARLGRSLLKVHVYARHVDEYSILGWWEHWWERAGETPADPPETLTARPTLISRAVSLFCSAGDTPAATGHYVELALAAAPIAWC